MSNNSKLNFLIFVIFALFLLTYFSFTYYHDDFIFLFKGLSNYNEIKSIFSLDVILQDRYLHEILMLRHFQIIGDNLVIYNLIKIFHIIILTSLLSKLCKVALEKIKYINYISFLLLVSPFLLGTTFWQTNLTWLFLINLHFAILILFIRYPNLYLLIFFLFINHIVSINLQFLIFNYIIAFLFLKKLTYKISFKKYYTIIIFNIIQILFSFYVILKTTEKDTFALQGDSFSYVIKSLIKNLAFIIYDFFQLFSFFSLIIVPGIFYLLIKNLKHFDKNTLYPLVGILLNFILFTFVFYDFRLQGIEARVSFLVGFYIHFLIIILFDKINENIKVIAIYVIFFIYLIGYTNHYLVFAKLKNKQNNLVEYLLTLNPDKFVNKIINVSNTTFDTKEKIKYFLFTKTNNPQWLKAEFQIYNEAHSREGIKYRILNYISK